MALKYDKLKFFWTVVAENVYYSVLEKGPFALEFWTKNRLFLWPQLSLKRIKTNTN